MIKETAANVALSGLAPTRMVHCRVYIGIKAALARRGFRPRGEGSAFNEFDVINGLKR